MQKFVLYCILVQKLSFVVIQMRTIEGRHAMTQSLERVLCSFVIGNSPRCAVRDDARISTFTQQRNAGAYHDSLTAPCRRRMPLTEFSAERGACGASESEKLIFVAHKEESAAGGVNTYTLSDELCFVARGESSGYRTSAIWPRATRGLCSFGRSVGRVCVCHWDWRLTRALGVVSVLLRCRGK